MVRIGFALALGWLDLNPNPDPDPKPHPDQVRSNEVKVERPAENAAAGVILDGEGEDDDTIVMVDNQGDGVDMSSMAHDKTGEGHGKLARTLLDTLTPP